MRRNALHDILMQSYRLGNRLIWNKKRIEENKASVVSPLSLQLVLSLLAAGSEGPTRRQIVNYLGAGTVDRLNSTASFFYDDELFARSAISCSTALWHDQSLSLNPSFQHTLSSHYEASVIPVDFRTKTPHVNQPQINGWAKNETNGLIQDLFRQKSLTNSVKLIFTNALHFNDVWQEKHYIQPHSYFEYSNCDIIVNAAFMTVNFGTDHGYGNSLQEYECSFQCVPYMSAKFYSTFHSDETLMEDDDKIPKCNINISYEVEASNTISALGMALPFSKGGLTEMLSCIEEGKKLYVCNIFQKSSIEINEQGTEAATVTTAIITSGPPYLPLVPTDIVPTSIVIPRNMAGVELSIMQVVPPGIFDVRDDLVWIMG